MANVVTSPDFSSVSHPYTLYDTPAIYGSATAFDSSQAPVLDTPLSYNWGQVPAESYPTPDSFTVTPKPHGVPGITQSAPIIGGREFGTRLHVCTYLGCGEAFEKRFQLKYYQ
jgi:hypothetical protein